MIDLLNFCKFSPSTTFWTSEIAQIWPDADASSTSTSIPRSTDMGTIRMILDLDYSELRIIQDRRNKSVLSGISSVGGLWFVDGSGRYLWGTVRQFDYEGSLQ